MKISDIRNIDFSNKTAIVRVDYNVPIKAGKITDHFRIDTSLATIKLLLEQNCKIILISHLGRPKGKINPELSLKVILPYLQNIFSNKIKFYNDFNEKIAQKIKHDKENSLIMIENIRFFPQEESNDDNFAKMIAQMADIYINEAFACSHRNSATISAISKFLPSYAGIRTFAEIHNINKIFFNAQRPIGAIIGGSKISTKISLLKALLNKVDILFIGGAMANTFLKAQNYDVGNSLVENEYISLAKQILTKAKELNVEVILPIDFIVAKNLDDNKNQFLNLKDKLNDKSIFDIGPKTIELFCYKINKLQTILWNGPVGAYEYQIYDQGSIAIAKFIANLTKQNKLQSIIGGGDTISIINKANFKNYSYISTAGGAFLEYIEKGELPGLENII